MYHDDHPTKSYESSSCSIKVSIKYRIFGRKLKNNQCQPRTKSLYVNIKCIYEDEVSYLFYQCFSLGSAWRLTEMNFHCIMQSNIQAQKQQRVMQKE